MGRILMIALAATFAARVSFAQATTSEEAILARLELLEQRIAELEAELARSKREIREARGAAAATGGGAGAATPAAGSLSLTSAGGGVSAGTTGAAAGSGGVEATISPESRLGQEAFINRDTVPTLGAGSFEFSQEFGYGRNESFLQSERALTSTTTLRYGIRRGLEVSLSLPAFYARRVTAAISGGSSSQIVTHTSGLGDAELGFSYILADQRRRRPGMTVTAAVILPTGASPYFFPASYTVGAVPLDLTESFKSHGHWGARLGTQFFKNADPLVLFWGGNVEYLFDRTVAGYRLARGLRYSANAGFSLALSPYTTVANSLQFNYEAPMYVNGVKVLGSNSETLTNRLVLIQRVGDRSYIEPSVTVGLTDGSGDVTFGFGYRKQW